ncbi:hypothetical protein RvY_06295 [Ramazzottius varieornatus]|uniref:Uncharacterized protein n=1 Tax=Ramazzottius varieornatus TaxID=947166 RepID=A0A1D1UY22_RAMVA|nr:hypothetical protein RvY_06295 [Ramazzottius varieornatus]
MTFGAGPTSYLPTGAPSNLQPSTGKTDTAAADGVADRNAQGIVEVAHRLSANSNAVTAAQRRSLHRRRVTGNRSESFAVLTYLVFGVVFCWTPIMVYFTIVIVDPNYDSYPHFIIDLVV